MTLGEKNKKQEKCMLFRKGFFFFFGLCICQKSMQFTEIKKNWGKSKS